MSPLSTRFTFALRRHARAAVPALALLLALAGASAEAADPAPGLKTRSPANVLADPRVRRCRELAARRASHEASFTALDTAVERAAILFELEPVFDGVAQCRAALLAFPGEPSVIVPHYTASEALSNLLFGVSFPDDDAAQLRLALEESGRDNQQVGLSGQLVGFYLGSAYEYGIGTPIDRAAAERWYGVAIAAGDPISRRELARMKSANP